MPSFSFFELHTPDLARSKAFYAEMFQWQFKDVPMPGQLYAVSDGDNHSGGMIQDQRPFWLNYITVDDNVKAAKKAEQLGGKILQPRIEIPGQGSFVLVADPTGVPMALWQVAAKS